MQQIYYGFLDGMSDIVRHPRQKADFNSEIKMPDFGKFIYGEFLQDGVSQNPSYFEDFVIGKLMRN